MIIFDLTWKETFNEVEKWIKYFKDKNDEEDAIIYLIGNKCDLEEDRVVESTSAVWFAEYNNIVYFECSSYTGFGLT